MYDKNTHTKSHTNVGQKRIQNRIHMYDKNAFKIASICMTKTRIEMYEKKHAYKCMKKKHSNTHTNV